MTMSPFTDDGDHGLQAADRPADGRVRADSARRRRPRVLAGATLAVAGAAAALTVAAGGSVTPAAHAVTKSKDGSLTLNLDTDGGLPGINKKLAAMGVPEEVTFVMGAGAPAHPGAVACTPHGKLKGPPISVTVGKGDSNKETLSGNTAAGTYHVVSCDRYDATTGPNIYGVPKPKHIKKLPHKKSHHKKSHRHASRHHHATSGR